MRYLLLLLALSPAWAQRESYGALANQYTKINNAAALSTRPIKEASSAPGTCAKGEQYFNTTSATIFACTTTNTWSAIGTGGGGTVTVVSSGALTSTALVTGGGTQTLQTPSATATLDSSGNISTPGSITTGAGGSTAGVLELTQGTAPTAGTTSVKLYAPASVTSYIMNLPGAAASGYLYGTNSSGVVTQSFRSIQAGDVPTLNQNTTGTAAGLTAQYIDWNASSGGNSIANKPTLVTTSTTDTFTNKTIDAEGTGNSITIPVKLWLPAVGCSGTTGTLMWDTLASNAPTATCSAGSTETTMMRGVADFPDSDGAYSLQQPILLPDDWSGAVDIKFLYRTTATTGNTVWQVATSCRADAEVDDAAFNTADALTADAAKGTTNQLNIATKTGITTTGCAAGELMHLKILRDRTHASDTITGVISLVGVELTLRRAM